MADETAALRRLAARAKRLRDQTAAAEQERDDEIRRLIAAGDTPTAVIAQAADIKPARVYQIRDRRRR